MSEAASPRTGWRARLKAEWLLLLFAALAAALALLDPRPAADYRRWLQSPTLAGLLGLLVAIQGIRDSGLVQRMAGALVARMHSLRTLGLLLVAATALLSMVLTNDVSLFLIVPLTVAIGGISNLPVARMAVLEALAVNAGSTLSPIGNPQNLLLWQHAHLPFLRFALAMLPAAAVMFVLVAALTLAWLPKGRVTLLSAQVDGHAVSVPLAVGSVAALAAMVLAMDHGRALEGALLLALAFAALARRSLARIDWLLLATFAAIFLGLGHLAELAPVRHGLDHLALDRPLPLYLAGIVASQLISNVPATVLLLDRAQDAIALAVAVNVGGFGLAIGSLANLIALRLAKQPQGLRLFHRVSVPFLLVCAPLVYLAWRWLG
ncbi:SLC13 family permease [Fulvimonas sp. R45]|uniref:SLC13 family permease n=1 Tax=Fulvimonas sp. R45 TaxID=3045937 RepID=UPI00265F5A41|nr:SLC13 family permease [Fulvimonas sp. R45]MDO1529127.1 SLC13 family permease [Fulvimonas sp. R45]